MDLIIVNGRIARTHRDNVFTGVNTFAGLKYAVVVKNTNYTLTDLDCVVVFTATASATLPLATGSGQIYYIKNVGTGTVTITRSGSNTIDNETTQPISQWESVTLVDYLSGKWIII